jgi:hypothetical protein
LHAFFLSIIRGIDKRFGALFDKGTDESDDNGQDSGGSNSFAANYGWIYSTEQVAELERITLDQAYDMNILQYLSDLVYIKEKQKNERKMMEEIRRNYK